MPPGCAFHPRCAYADRTGGLSQTVRPPFSATLPRHYAACHLTQEQRTEIWENEIRPTL